MREASGINKNPATKNPIHGRRGSPRIQIGDFEIELGELGGAGQPLARDVDHLRRRIDANNGEARISERSGMPPRPAPNIDKRPPPRKQPRRLLRPRRRGARHDQIVGPGESRVDRSR